MNPDIENLTLEAMRCRSCFESGWVRPATIDIAQPRWIGPKYWESKNRVSVLLINPGAGAKYASKRNERDREMLHEALKDTSRLYDYLELQRQDLPKWGRGRFWKFFVEGVGLDPDAIAFANIAWCATEGDRYPRKMRDQCFEQFTARYLQLLAPEIILLCGSATKRFHHRMQRAIPEAVIIPTLHYSHRKGIVVEENEICRLQNVLNKEKFF